MATVLDSQIVRTNIVTNKKTHHYTQGEKIFNSLSRVIITWDDEDVPTRLRPFSQYKYHWHSEITTAWSETNYVENASAAVYGYEIPQLVFQQICFNKAMVAGYDTKFLFYLRCLLRFSWPCFPLYVMNCFLCCSHVDTFHGFCASLRVKRFFSIHLFFQNSTFCPQQIRTRLLLSFLCVVTVARSLDKYLFTI